MPELTTILLTGIALLKLAVFWLAVAALVVFTVDWLVRTRRLDPFGPVARLMRRTIDPLLVPIERRVVLAGQLPSSAPWWALVVVVLGGIALIYVAQVLAGMILTLVGSASAGPTALVHLAVRWVFAVLIAALFLRVVASWLGLSTYRWWLRWTVTLTDWLLRPLRRVLPPVGMFDISPLVALLILWVVQQVVLTVI